MKLRIIYTTGLLLFIAFISMSNRAGRADGQNWGNTGAPGDEEFNGQPRTCQTCHSSGSIQVSLNISLTDPDGASVVNDYIPGTTYDLEVLIEDVGSVAPAAHGFQLIALDDANDQEINTWTEPGSNVKFSLASNTGRTYPEHTPNSSSNSFKMKWTAPAEGTGGITFYACGNGVNGTGSNGGDGADCSTLSLGEGMTSSSADVLNKSFQVNLFPNPASDLVNIEISTSQQAEYRISLVNAFGSEFNVQYQMLNQGSNKLNLAVSEFPTGMYFLKVQNLRETLLHKWMKL